MTDFRRKLASIQDMRPSGYSVRLVRLTALRLQFRFETELKGSEEPFPGENASAGKFPLHH